MYRPRASATSRRVQLPGSARQGATGSVVVGAGVVGTRVDVTATEVVGASVVGAGSVAGSAEPLQALTRRTNAAGVMTQRDLTGITAA